MTDDTDEQLSAVAPGEGDGTPAPGEPGTAGAALADLAAGYGEAYEPYYGTPAPWSSDRLEAIMRESVDAQAQEQRQLETLLADVRAALTAREVGGAGPGASDAALDRIVAALESSSAESRQRFEEQQRRFADQQQRLDELAKHLDELASVGDGGGATVQDLHDGLAGVRTDMTSLPELLGPAVTSAITHGLGETMAMLRNLSARLDRLETAAVTRGTGAAGPSAGPELAALTRQVESLAEDLRAMRLASEGPASPGTALVAQVQASEQRLAHHVDEAVLALAQAVLRRRPAGGPPTDAPQDGHEVPAVRPEPPAGDLPPAELAGAALDDVRPAPGGDAPEARAAGEPAGAEPEAAVEPRADREVVLPDAMVASPEEKRGLFRRHG